MIRCWQGRCDDIRRKVDVRPFLLNGIKAKHGKESLLCLTSKEYLVRFLIAKVQKTTLVFSKRLHPLMLLLLAFLGKASTCQTESRKTKRMERRVVIIAVLADGGGVRGRGCLQAVAIQRLLLLKDMCSEFLYCNLGIWKFFNYTQLQQLLVLAIRDRLIIYANCIQHSM